MINKDELEIDKLELKTVKAFFEWRNTNGKSVEDINRKYTCNDKLNWQHVDVLYSFLGIYAIGFWVYNKDLCKTTDFEIKCDGKRVYSENFLSSVQNSDKYNVEELNQVVIPFLKIYGSLGNVFPMWPGGNVHKGNAMIGCLDIPERYFNIYYDWFLALMEIYKDNICFKDVINKETPKLPKYSSLKNFLKSVNETQKYKNYINDICKKIEQRNTDLINILKNYK